MKKKLIFLASLCLALAFSAFLQVAEVEASGPCQTYCAAVFPISPQPFFDCVNVCEARNCPQVCAIANVSPQVFFPCYNCCVFDHGCP